MHSCLRAFAMVISSARKALPPNICISNYLTFFKPLLLNNTYPTVLFKILSPLTCTPMFTAALFTTAKTWEQPKCPSTEEWIKKVWHRYTMEYYSAIKKNEIKTFAATWIDLGIIILSEVSQTEKAKCHRISLICGI